MGHGRLVRTVLWRVWELGGWGGEVWSLELETLVLGLVEIDQGCGGVVFMLRSS